MIDSEALHDGGLQVVDVNGVFGDVKGHVLSGSVRCLVFSIFPG